MLDTLKTEVYVLNIASRLDAPVEIEKYKNLFSPERFEKISRFKFNADKNRAIWAELLAREIISRKTEINIQNIIIKRDITGKPHLDANLKLKLNLKISLSHSGSWVALSVGELDNGVDVENIDRKINLKIAKRFFLDSEYKYLNNLNIFNNNLKQEFLKYWTIKESCLKCLNLRDWSGVDCEKILSGNFVCNNKKISGKNFVLPDGAVVGVCEAI